MTLTEKSKNVLNFLFRLSFSVILLIFIFRKIDWDKTQEVLKHAQLNDILYGALMFVIIHFILIARWLIYIRALGLAVPFKSVVRYFFAGLFGNLFLPTAIGGDMIKMVGLCRDSAQKPKVVASVLLDRLSGFAGIVIVAVFSFVFAFRMIQDISLMISIGILAGVSLGTGFLLFYQPAYARAGRIFDRIPKLKQGLMNMHYDIALLKDRRDAIYKAVGLSCVSQFIFALTFYFIARALHQQIALVYFLIFVPLICAASAVPSIGGLGPREAGAAYLFSKIGVSSGIAVSISLMNFFFMVVVGLLGGLYFLCTTNSYHPQPKEIYGAPLSS